MPDYSCILFDLYSTLIEDQGGPERDRYRVDSIYTLLEKSLYPVKFAVLLEKYETMARYIDEFHGRTNRAFAPFAQVQMLLSSLNIQDIVLFKKVYDVYSEADLQISPVRVHNADRALALLRERGRKIGLVSNTGKAPGVVLRLVLKQLGLFDYFDDMLFSDEFGFLKPEAIVFDTAVRRLEAAKEDTLFIGDLKYSDFDGATNAGLNAHLFRQDSEDLFELAAHFSGGY